MQEKDKPNKLEDNCADLYFCPFIQGGRCIFSDMGIHQALYGAPEEGWDKFSWFKYIYGLMSTTSMYCLNPEAVVQALDKNRPKLVPENRRRTNSGKRSNY